MKEVILKIRSVKNNKVSMTMFNGGSFDLSFSVRSPSVEKADKFRVGETYKVKLSKIDGIKRIIKKPVKKQAKKSTKRKK